MSAELLREAAAKMRERAEATVVTYTDGDILPWHSQASLELEWDAEDAGHIAGMSPAVALAVALLLDNEANAMDSEWREEFDLPTYNSARADLLTNIARAYLGEAS